MGGNGAGGGIDLGDGSINYFTHLVLEHAKAIYRYTDVWDERIRLLQPLPSSDGGEPQSSSTNRSVCRRPGSHWPTHPTDITSVACRVGYGSPSQFRRDYRQFGASPRQDAARLQTTAESTALVLP